MTKPGRTRQAALQLYTERATRIFEAVSCQVCAHEWAAHCDLGGRGCAACEGAGRVCPAYVPGPLPHQAAKHLDPLGSDAGPCPWLCGHPAGTHSGAGQGCLSCGCGYGSPGAAPPEGITYRGYPADDLRGHRIVVIEAPAGTPVSLLPEVSRHSPTGFAWGYGGSGPAALARSLLVSVLGPAAACPACKGHRKVAWDNTAGAMAPSWELAEAETDLGPAIDCGECDDGYRDLPYHGFKFAMIAPLPGNEEWSIARADILRWLAGADPAAHAAALDVLPGTA